jgi:hypothetical protein
MGYSVHVVSLWPRQWINSHHQVCQWLMAGTPDSYTNKTNHHDITEILLKVVLNTINLTPYYCNIIWLTIGICQLSPLKLTLTPYYCNIIWLTIGICQLSPLKLTLTPYYCNIIWLTIGICQLSPLKLTLTPYYCNIIWLTIGIYQLSPLKLCCIFLIPSYKYHSCINNFLKKHIFLNRVINKM